MPLPVVAGTIAAAAAVALSDPYIRGALIGTGVYAGDQALQGGINRGLRAKNKKVRKVAGVAADAYEAIDKSELAGIWKHALVGAASDRIGRKSEKFIRKRQERAASLQRPVPVQMKRGRPRRHSMEI